MSARRGHRAPADAAQEGSERLSLPRLVSSSSHALVLLDGRGAIVASNDRAAALLNRGHNHLQGQPLASLFPERDREAISAGVQAALRGEPVDDLETGVRDPEGNRERLAVALLHAPTDAGPRVLVLLRDASAERRERDLAAHEADELRSAAAENRRLADLGKLVSGIAHELRTPLTFVSNMLELQRHRLEELARQRPDIADDLAECRELNATTVAGIERVSRLVRDLRPLTKNKPPRPTRMDLAELVTEAVRVFRGSHPGRTRVDLDLEATHVLELDREQMVNVLLNLLNNAAEAMGHEGRVLVQTRNRDAPPEIRVVDSGPGIDPAAADRIFEPFYTTKVDGTGLGLFIARRTVEAHGGTLTCRTNPDGRGATFVVRLPIPPEP